VSTCAVANSSMVVKTLATSPQHLIAKVSNPKISSSNVFSALIDCGCTNSFISCDLVTQYALPCKSLSKLLRLTLFDRSFSGYITHSVDLTFKFKNELSDSWTFLQTKLSSDCQFTLSLNWLHSQNPTIDWASGMFAFKPHVELTLEPSEPLGIPFAKYPIDMFAQKSKDSLATFANSLENSPDVNSKDRNLPIPTPGERNVDLCPADIAIVDPPAFCSIIEEGSLMFAICMPTLKSSISAKSSIPSNVLDDKDSVEELPNHIPHCCLEFADVFSGKNADKLPP
jgi:Retroviral aspartyl protease